MFTGDRSILESTHTPNRAINARGFISGISLLVLVAFTLHPAVAAAGAERNTWAVDRSETAGAARYIAQSPVQALRKIVRRQRELPAAALWARRSAVRLAVLVTGTPKAQVPGVPSLVRVALLALPPPSRA